MTPKMVQFRGDLEKNLQKFSYQKNIVIQNLEPKKIG